MGLRWILVWESVWILKRVLVLELRLRLVVLVESTKGPLAACCLLVVLKTTSVLETVIVLKLTVFVGRRKEITLCRNTANVVAELFKMRIEKSCQFSWGEPRKLLNATDDVVASSRIVNHVAR